MSLASANAAPLSSSVRALVFGRAEEPPQPRRQRPHANRITRIDAAMRRSHPLPLGAPPHVYASNSSTAIAARASASTSACVLYSVNDTRHVAGTPNRSISGIAQWVPAHTKIPKICSSSLSPILVSSDRSSARVYPALRFPWFPWFPMMRSWNTEWPGSTTDWNSLCQLTDNQVADKTGCSARLWDRAARTGHPHQRSARPQHTCWELGRQRRIVACQNVLRIRCTSSYRSHICHA